MVVGFWGYSLNLPLVLDLILSPEIIPKPILQIFVFDRIFEILLYFGILFFSAALSGSGLRKLITKFNWDERVSFLRFEAPWYYLFKVPYDANLFDSTDLPDIALVSFLMDTNDGTYLFTGFLESFFLTKTGQLDRIILLAPMRRRLSKDFIFTEQNVENFNVNEPNFDDRYYLISADKLVAKYDQMKNLTVSYVKIP
ncbi:MAG: hypothetical protein IIB64_06070 [Proteobacteria bacterium]|nr:hypothetical protein [Pseudomonadota bacterium]